MAGNGGAPQALVKRDPQAETSTADGSKLLPHLSESMEGARELAGDSLSGDGDRSCGEMRFSRPLAARCVRRHKLACQQLLASLQSQTVTCDQTQACGAFAGRVGSTAGLQVRRKPR